MSGEAKGPVMYLFSNGAMGITCAGSAVHLNPEETSRLLDQMRSCAPQVEENGRQVLRVTCYVDLTNAAIVELVAANRWPYRFTFTDPDQVLEAAEKLRAVGEAMKREDVARELTPR